jgi:hypothetical protein
MNASDFRIEEIRKAKVNGRAVKTFKAFRKDGDAFVFCGQFSAPAKTANKDLWKIADAAKLSVIK